MDVTFTKAPGRRYFMTVARERGVALASRQGPGYHDYLPHDAVHLLVESEAGLSGGVFGRIAAGEANIFAAAEQKQLRRVARREARRRPTEAQSRDMQQSELLASVCLVAWERMRGVRKELPDWAGRVDPRVLESDLVKRILARLDEFAERWHALPVDGELTLHWNPRRRAA